jgi:hypothetical protein
MDMLIFLLVSPVASLVSLLVWLLASLVMLVLGKSLE